MTDYKTEEIKRRHAIGEHHKANYLANTARKIAKEYGIPHGTMHDCLFKGRKIAAITQEQFEEAQRRVEYSREQKALYEKHSPRVLRETYKIGEHTLREMVRDSIAETDPVRRFFDDEVSGLSDREEFEKWLLEVHGLNAEWDEDRNCYVEFACHIAWKAWRAARAQGGEAVAAVNKASTGEYEFYPASGLVGMPNGIHKLYAHPSASVPEVADEEMLTEGVEALIRGLKAFPDNYAQVVSNIWEDMAAAANPPTEGAE